MIDRDTIIRMAREAGLFTHREVQPEIERFAALVAAAEREECAKVCDEFVDASSTPNLERPMARRCAFFIRARSEV